MRDFLDPGGKNCRKCAKKFHRLEEKNKKNKKIKIYLTFSTIGKMSSKHTNAKVLDHAINLSLAHILSTIEAEIDSFRQVKWTSEKLFLFKNVGWVNVSFAPPSV